MLNTNSALDFRQIARFPDGEISLVYADVTCSAKALEKSHLCGPTAGLIQGEALAAVALLGTECSRHDETVSLRITTDGPIGGMLVEANAEGDLRGYTQKKVLNTFDDDPHRHLAEALGGTGKAEIIRSIPGKLLDSAVNEVIPPTPLQALLMYYRFSNQRHVAAEIFAKSEKGYLTAVRGLFIERMPDGDEELFSKMESLFDNGTVLRELEKGATFTDICKELGIDAPILADPTPLRFACHCTPERVENMLHALPAADLKELSEKNEPIRIFCHLCGKAYEIKPERIKEIVNGKNV